MATERPILFSGAMVRAILEGRKAQTRRVVKPTMSTPKIAPLEMEPWIIDGERQEDDNGLPCWAGYHPSYPGEAKWFTCPYGQPGDRLWVRETWHLWGPPEHQTLAFRADCADAENYTWRPSIFMPRWASRITLEITDVRVERVQAISKADVLAEGISRYTFAKGAISATPPDPRWKFIELWDGINAKRGYSWASNPWVWVLTFTRVQP